MTSKVKQLGATWDTLAHKIIACVLVDHGSIFPVLDVLGQGMHWFPPKVAPVWAGVLQCVEDGVPPTVEAVTTRCATSNGYIQSIANQWTDDDNRQVAYHAEELRRLGALAEYRKLGREILEITDPADVTGAVGYASSRLSGILSATTRRQGDAQVVGDSAYAKMEQFKGNGIPTGMGWFDELTGGMWPGMNYWIAAAYKQGKSTLMRNIILAVLEAGHAADVYCAEGSREMFALDCQAMIATRLIYEAGERERNPRLSGLFLMRSFLHRRAMFTRQELEAVAEARAIWDGYNLRVWDAADGITNLGVLRNRVQKSKFDHGSLVHWGDYSQLFGPSGPIYERQSAVALAVQQIAATENVVFGMLTQRNEAGIRGGESYSASVKGGGDASAAADVMLIPCIDEMSPVTFTVKLKFSRHSGTGMGEHLINPSSGLLLDRWQRRPLPVELE